jgi:hypothetical protein
MIIRVSVLGLALWYGESKEDCMLFDTMHYNMILTIFKIQASFLILPFSLLPPSAPRPPFFFSLCDTFQYQQVTD